MTNLTLMLRMLRRDWRAGELTVLGLALAVAVASLTSVGFLTDRVGQALVQESHQLLGGDLLLTADHPWRAKIRGEARQRGLTLTDSVSFPSMVSAAGTAQLAEVKAVAPGYPPRRTDNDGRLESAEEFVEFHWFCVLEVSGRTGFDGVSGCSSSEKANTSGAGPTLLVLVRV